MPGRGVVWNRGTVRDTWVPLLKSLLFIYIIVCMTMPTRASPFTGDLGLHAGNQSRAIELIQKKIKSQTNRSKYFTILFDNLFG